MIESDLINALTNIEKQNPLHYAAKNGSLKAVYTLVKEFNADIEAKDHQCNKLKNILYILHLNLTR